MNRRRVTPRPKAKYGNTKVTRDGIMFDSKREAERYEQLKHEQMAGAISDLQLQFRIKLFAGRTPLRFASSNRQIVYVADFYYYDNQRNAWVIEDSKGFRTPEYKLKRAIVESMIANTGAVHADDFTAVAKAEGSDILFKET